MFRLQQQERQQTRLNIPGYGYNKWKRAKTENVFALFVFRAIIALVIGKEGLFLAENIVSPHYKFYKSFSGTDTIAFLIMPGCTPVVLGSLTTISYSIFRNKKPVINIGRTNINGVTRGSRIYAGTMIFTLINQHWLRELQDQCDWVGNLEDLKADELPLFDIMIVSANEYGSAVEMYIYGIDFTDEGQTISVEDMFTENTFSFIARELSIFKKFDINTGVHKHSASKSDSPAKESNRFLILDHSLTSLDALADLEREFSLSLVDFLKTNKNRIATFVGDLKRSVSNRINTEVANVQEYLNSIAKKYYHDINGLFDGLMEDVVKLFQSDHGLDITGIVDIRTYESIVNAIDDVKERTAVVVNKFGAQVFEKPSIFSKIVDLKPFKDFVNIYNVVANEDDGVFQRFFQTKTGYIKEEDLYSSFYTGNIIEFPTIEYGDSSNYVTMAKAALSTIYPQFVNNSSVCDDETVYYIKKFQKENNLDPTGKIDMNTWRVLQEIASEKIHTPTDDSFRMKKSQPSGEYKIPQSDLSNQLPNFYVDIETDSPINVKVTTISKYGKKHVVESKVLTINRSGKISAELCKNAFTYNPECGKTPDSVDIIIYPYNKKAEKWTFSK